LHELTISAVKDARAQLADTNKLTEAVVKYAFGTAELEKRAATENTELRSFADELDSLLEPGGDGVSDELAQILDGDEHKDDVRSEMDKLLDEEECGDGMDMGNATTLSFTPTGGGKPMDLQGDVSLKSSSTPVEGKISIASKEDRAQARIKLAQKGLLGFNALSEQAHPHGSVDAVEAGNLDVKPNVPGSAFHVKKDIQEKMLQLANLPPKVRKQAEQIQKLVSSGAMSPELVDGLASYGVDGDAIKYWKQFWGQAGDSESKEFASQLVSNELSNVHESAKKAAELETYKGRIKRAYEFANQMVVKGMISEAQVDSQVEDILKWNDAGYESMKNILARQPAMVRQASIPTVGLLDSGAVILPSVQGFEQQTSGTDIKGFFDNYFAQRKF
jgi:hypothetical protein